MKSVNLVEGYDYIVCPICGRHIHRMKSHLRSHKEISDRTQYLKDHPELPLLSGIERDRNSNAGKSYCKAHPNVMGERARIGWETTKKQWADPEFVAMKKKNSHETMLRMNRNPEFSRMAMKNLVNWQHREYWYNGINYRSDSEAKIAEYLDKHQIKFLYEDLKIPYFINNEEHTYTPDFFHN